MRIQLLDRTEMRNDRNGPLQCVAVVSDETGATLELVNSQTAERLACAAGRKDMTWPRNKIANNHRGKITDENRACRENSLRHFFAILSHEGEVLGSKFVCNPDRLFARFGQDEEGAVFKDFAQVILSVQRFNLNRDFRLN